ncbi:MAG: right-handed parallel beta-helix repeat-containing protein [Acidobacteria bacterium]|nr:right-handed parallel beta-helix repeat-containing protein [Acidobacteriota bacterium]MCA1620355.1 right-handed parallel beta-helix repeat-containing protein [Acidobacteriota bacterium]
MTKFRFALTAFAVTAFIALASSSASAQATRTWVSGVGDDVNPCSRTAPCKTYAGAISKTAANGEISTLDPGGFGAITITKSITIEGSQGQGYGSILASGTNGVVINDSLTAAPGTIIVSLRNLSITGAASTNASSGLVGILITSGKVVHVENCIIQGFKAGAARGISDRRTLNGGLLFVKDTIVRNNGGGGIVVIPASGTPTLTSSLDNVRLEQNGETGPGTGYVIGGANIKGSISNSVASRNATHGISAESGAKLTIDSCAVTFNGSNGVDALNAGTVIRISNSVVSGNTGAGLGLSGGAVRSFGNNRLLGNGTDTNPTNTDLQQ